MRDYIKFRELIKGYLNLCDRSQSDLAGAIGLSEEEVSRRFNYSPGNKKKPFNHNNVNNIVHTLTEWGCIKTRQQAQELIDLMESPGFSDTQWNAPPLNKLENIPASSSVVASGIADGLDYAVLGVGLRKLPHEKIESDNLKVDEEFIYGRTELIQEICEELNPDRPDSAQHKVVVLYGEEGGGKLSVAKEVGNRLKSGARRPPPDSVPTTNPPSATPPPQANYGQFETVILGEFQIADDKANLYESFINFIASKIGLKIFSGINVKTEAFQLQEDLKGRSILIIVGKIEEDITQWIIDFTLKIDAPHIKLLITQNKKPAKLPAKCRMLEVSSLKDTMVVRQFIEKRCGHSDSFTLSDKDVERIIEDTNGNLVYLTELTNLINQGEKSLASLLKAIENMAQSVVGYAINSLSPLEKDILYAHSLFEDSAHLKIIRDILLTRYDEVALEELPPTIERLVAKTYLEVLNPPRSDEGKRHKLKSTFFRFVRNRLKDYDMLDSWRESWLKQYLKLRPRTPSLDDESGWTIFIDYPVYEKLKVNINHPDEVSNIRNLLRFCIAPHRIATYWEAAAQLLDNFRATLFAAGPWEVRTRACVAVIPWAEQRGEWHYVGQLERLLAWMYCYTDDYPKAQLHAQRAFEVAASYIARSQELRERIIHSQTFYKSLVTQGLIEMRRGQDEAIKGHRARKTSPEEVRPHLMRARKHFKAAKTFFIHAHTYVRSAYKPETLIVEYYLAEVAYYERHCVSLWGGDKEMYLYMEKVRERFKKIVKKAQVRNHKRLEANATYILAKTTRRLADLELKIEMTTTPTPDTEEPADKFEQAHRHFEKAQNMADEFKDIVLLARLDFARGQWYENLWRKTGASDDARMKYFEKARKYVQQGMAEFIKFGLDLEAQDAAIFLEQRLPVMKAQSRKESDPGVA